MEAHYGGGVGRIVARFTRLARGDSMEATLWVSYPRAMTKVVGRWLDIMSTSYGGLEGPLSLADGVQHLLFGLGIDVCRWRKGIKFMGAARGHVSARMGKRKGGEMIK